MGRRFLNAAWQVMREAIRHLAANDLFRMAGATAFFTTFALPAMLIIIVQTIGLFADRKTVGHYMGERLGLILGADSMDSIRTAILSFRALLDNYLLGTAIFVFLVFVATTLFKVIKNSLNDIWGIRAAPGQFGAMLRSRAISIAVILLGGLLFLGVELIDAGQHLFGPYLISNLPGTTFYLGGALHKILLAGVSTTWFYVLFLYLPDGRPSRRIALGGAFCTSVLFMAGKALLHQLLSPGRVNKFYGASGALVLVLLFVFYTSIILYFGAAVIRALSDVYGQPVLPKGTAYRYRVAPLEEPL